MGFDFSIVLRWSAAFVSSAREFGACAISSVATGLKRAVPPAPG